MSPLENPHPSQIRPLRRVEYDRLVELGFFEGPRIELVKKGPQASPQPGSCRF